MIVIGLNKLPHADAQKRFGAVFSVLLGELRRKQWSSLPDFLRFYPKARHGADGTVHIPLAPDGSGIVSTVSFNPGIIRLLRIALAPQPPRRTTLSHPSTHPKSQPQPHATNIP